ncbi:MAG: PBP superfamily domain protein [Methanoregulaceae archaeon PtaU1.Bin222]|nr:MAG: PBP superfamily domain protein [Methanoregulaceae archaeon PtaU1.Bin222]
MNAIRKMKENEHAVSPIVATLVLIVVAVVGAVAVGTIMGTFSSDVSKKTSAGEAGSASSAEILIGGSTTVQPVAEAIAKEYKKVSPGVEVSVNGGGSGAGVNAVGMGTIDIGASSDLSKITTARTTHPEWDLRETMIGGSAVVFIVSDDVTVNGSVSDTELKAFYENGTPIANITATTAYHRAESSGTEETAANWVRGKNSFDDIPSRDNLKTVSGNSGMLAAIQTDTVGLGFIDMGFAFPATGGVASGIKVLNITGYQPTTKDNIKDAAKGVVQGYTSTKYPKGLARGLYLITAGEPSILEKDFISFAAGPQSIDAVHAAGVFHVLDLM